MTIRGGFMHRLEGGEETRAFRLSDLNHRALTTLWRYVKAYRGRLLLALLATLGVTATTLSQPFLMKVAVDTMIVQGNLRGLTLIALLYLAVTGIYWFAVYWQGVLSSWVGQHVVYALRRDLFDNVLRQSMAFHDAARVGEVASRLTNDVNAVADLASSGLLNLVNDLLSLGGIIAIMALLNLRLTLVMLLSLPVVILSMSLLGRAMRRTYRQVQEALAEVNARVEQDMAGMRVVQSLSRESLTVEQFESLSLRNMRANLRAGLLFAAVFPTMTITNMLGVALVLGYGGTLVTQGELTIGVLLAFLGYVYRFFGPLRELSLVYNTFQAAAAALDRVVDYLSREPTLVEPADPRRPARGFRGDIAFQGVTFGYAETPVLHNVELRVASGETLALVGPTGAGKSTLGKLAARLYDPQMGVVRIDGIDVRDLAFADLRRLVTLVPQDVFLFADTIRENIRYGNPAASDAEVEAAARQAQAHTFIIQLPQRYDTQVGELGARLSGGQKQLVAFARALLADPRILILDEATANVDAYTEAQIQRAMDVIRQDRTTLIIAHRFSTLRKADRIAVVDEGRIVGLGTHAKLVEQNATYRRLYTSKLGGTSSG